MGTSSTALVLGTTRSGWPLQSLTDTTRGAVQSHQFRTCLTAPPSGIGYDSNGNRELQTSWFLLSSSQSKQKDSSAKQDLHTSVWPAYIEHCVASGGCIKPEKCPQLMSVELILAGADDY